MFSTPGMPMKVVHSFPTYEQAHLAVAFLESVEIDAYVWDENVAALYPLFNPSLGMYRLAVDESVYEAACKALEDWLDEG